MVVGAKGEQGVTMEEGGGASRRTRHKTPETREDKLSVVLCRSLLSRFCSISGKNRWRDEEKETRGKASQVGRRKC